MAEQKLPKLKTSEAGHFDLEYGTLEFRTLQF